MALEAAEAEKRQVKTERQTGQGGLAGELEKHGSKEVLPRDSSGNDENRGEPVATKAEPQTRWLSWGRRETQRKRGAGGRP